MTIHSTQEAVDIIKGEIYQCSKEEIRQAWQYLVDTGAVWDMQSPYGNWWPRMASCLIEAGVIRRNAA